MDLSLQDVAMRMVAATLLCGVIGVERELRQKPAGVRTSALVGLGATVMTMCGMYIAQYFPGTTDPSRIASIVVQGIGFIGAGVIIQSSGEVHGLTTAATMWLVAGIGIAIGFGLYYIALLATPIALVLLVIFGPLDARLMGMEQERKRRGGLGKWFDKKGQG